MALLPLNHTRKLFFRIETKRLNKDSAAIINHINNSWEDIEYLNYLFYIANSRFSETENQDEMIMIFNALCVFGKNFYIHLEIIRKLVCKLIKELSDKELRELYEKNKEDWEKIRIIRNNVIIHKEGNDYIIPTGFRSQSTDPSGISIELQYLTKRGEKTIKMIPIDDACKAKEFLEKLKNILETKKV